MKPCKQNKLNTDKQQYINSTKTNYKIQLQATLLAQTKEENKTVTTSTNYDTTRKRSQK